MSDREPEYLTVKQFAERHAGAMSPWLVGESVRRGQLPHVRVGRKILIPANALDLMAERQAGGHSSRANSRG